MKKTIVKTKNIILFLGSLWLCCLYIENIYELSAWYVLNWWYYNYSQINIDFEIFAALFFFILFFILMLFLSGIFINTLILAIFGREGTYVYLGNSCENNGKYFEMENPLKKEIIDIYITEKFSVGFNDLLKIHHFLIFHTLNTRVNKGKRIDIYHQLIIFILFYICLIVSFPIIHQIVYPVHADFFNISNQLTNNSITADSTESFELLIISSGLNISYWVLIFFGSIVLILPLRIFSVKSRDVERSLKLPSDIQHKNYLYGIPVDITNEYISERDDDDISRTTKTGNSIVTFKFSKIFDPPVYVSSTVSQKNRRLIEKINKSKSNKTQIKVKIKKDFGITPLISD